MKAKIVFYRRDIEIPNAYDIDFYTYREIMYITYDSPYCILHCMNNGIKKKYFVCTSLIKFETNLPVIFYKCSQSVIINNDYLRRYDSRNRLLIMRDDAEFSLPLRKTGDFKKHKAILEQVPVRCLTCNVYAKDCSGCTEPCNDEIAGYPEKLFLPPVLQNKISNFRI